MRGGAFRSTGIGGGEPVYVQIGVPIDSSQARLRLLAARARINRSAAPHATDIDSRLEGFERSPSQSLAQWQ